MLKNIKDEVLNGDELYTIRDKQGNIIKDDVDISLKTPISQQGTPINKALFDNMQGDLYTQDRYNLLTPEFVNQDEEKHSGNFEINNWVNVTTEDYRKSNSNCLCLDPNQYFNKMKVSATSDTIDSIEFKASNIFQNDSAYIKNHQPSKNLTVNIEFVFPLKITKVLVKYDISSGTTGVNFNIQGSENNQTWANLYTNTALNFEGIADFSNNKYYKYYRVVISHSSTNSTTYLSKFIIQEFYTNSKIIFNANLPLSSYENGKKISVNLSPYTVKEENYTIEKNIATNIIPKMINDQPVANKYGTWTATHNFKSSSTDGNLAYKAFDQNNSTYALLYRSVDHSLMTIYLNNKYTNDFYDLSNVILPKSFSIRCKEALEIRIRGYNYLKGIWEVLGTKAISAPTNIANHVLANDKYSEGTFYSCFAFDFESNVETVYVYEIAITSPTVKYGVPVAQKINKFENPEIKFNENLELKQIEGIIKSGLEMDLKYDEIKQKFVDMPEMIVGNYIGTCPYRPSENYIYCGFKPSLIIVTGTGNSRDACMLFASPNGSERIGFSDSRGTPTITFDDFGVSLTSSESAIYVFNNEGGKYMFFAFK